MKESNKFIIYTNPLPYSRERFVHGHAYNPRNKYMKECKALLRLSLLHKKFKIIKNQPIKMKIIFYIKAPKYLSSSKNKKELLLNNEISHIKKPDLSNLIKLFEDVATGILYEDDNLINVIIAKKYYVYDNPKVIYKLYY